MALGHFYEGNANDAMKWALETGNRVATIDLRQVSSQVLDLSSEAGRLDILRNPIGRTYAASSAEVLVESFIPPRAIISVL